MIDMTATIEPKSDQLNADDLIGGPRTITITRVNANEGNVEQPVNVFFEGDNNKPFRPCKSMRRVMVHCWGKDAQKYVGKSMTLFRDPEVTWGGMKVGGIRISHMSHIDGPETMALTATQKARKPYTVKPLAPPEPKADRVADGVRDLLARIAATDDIAALIDAPEVVKQRAWLAKNRPELADEVANAIAALNDDDPFGTPTAQPDFAPADFATRLQTCESGAAFDALNAEYAAARDALDDDARALIDPLIERGRTAFGEAQ